MDYSKIVEHLKKEHCAFVDKYSVYIEKNVTEHHIEKETVFARLSLLGKAFLSAGIISRFEEVMISGSDRNLAFYTQFGDVFYFLNGIDIVVFVPGQFSIMDGQQNIHLLSYASEDERVVMKDVLSKDFDWFEISQKILEIIHKTAYRKTEALNDYIGQLFVKPDGD